MGGEIIGGGGEIMGEEEGGRDGGKWGSEEK